MNSNINEEELKEKYFNLVRDSRFNDLVHLLQKSGFPEIEVIKENDRRNAADLAWLLNPWHTKGLGEDFIRLFLRKMFSINRRTEISAHEVEDFDYRNASVYIEWFYVVLIEFDNLVIAIESPVSIKGNLVHPSRHYNVMQMAFPNKKKVFAYLTVQELVKFENTDNYIPITHQFIIDILEKLKWGDTIDSNLKVNMNNHIKRLEKEIVESKKPDETIVLAKWLYKEHKEVLDFLFEHEPYGKEQLSEFIKNSEIQFGLKRHKQSLDFIFKHKPVDKEQVLELFKNAVLKQGWGNRFS